MQEHKDSFVVRRSREMDQGEVASAMATHADQQKSPKQRKLARPRNLSLPPRSLAHLRAFSRDSNFHI